MRLAPAANPWLLLWAPQRLAWWIALFFIIGSACFAAGSFASNWPQYWPSDFVSSRVISTVFFTGSLFFTTAAGLQLLEAINGDVADIDATNGTDHRSWRWFAWKPQSGYGGQTFIPYWERCVFSLPVT